MHRKHTDIATINKHLRDAGLADKAFRPRNAPRSIIAVNLDADADRPGKIAQEMRNVGYILDGDYGWQLTFRPA